MDVIRKWYCACTGQPRELVFVAGEEDDLGEPACPRCGASPSADPRHTVGFSDVVKPGDRPV